MLNPYFKILILAFILLINHFGIAQINDSIIYQFPVIIVNQEFTDVKKSTFNSLKNYQNHLEKLVYQYENEGFPFVEIKPKIINAIKDSIFIFLDIEKNNLIVYDTLSLKGDLELKKSYLERYFKIKPGNYYNEKEIKDIKSKISKLPFAQAPKNYEIAFYDSSATVFLYLNKRKSSNFEGVLGFLPDDLNPGKVLITGDLKLKLHNSFGRGELIQFNFKKLQSQTQELSFRHVQPYFFGSNLGTDFSLDIFRKDTTFINVNRNINLLYHLRGSSYFKIFGRFKNSNLISTSGYRFAARLPEFADTRNNLYGIGFFIENIDNRINPTKGFSFEADFALGERNITRNLALPAQLYENIRLKSTGYEAEAKFSVFIPLGKRLTFGVKNLSGIINNEVNFRTDLYRLGGINSMRGFDEQSIFAGAYTLSTFEPRLLIDQTGYIFLFASHMYYESNTIENRIYDNPISFGTGITFETKAGILTLVYALGRQFENNFQLRSGKIHFGLTTNF